MPRVAQEYAAHRPMTPPPTIRILLTDPPAERIALVEHQRRLGRDVRAARDARRNLAGGTVEPIVRGLEAAADDAFLHPRLARRELAVGREAGELRARAGAAGRAVVGLSRAKDEVARARRRRGGPEQLDVIDVGKPLRVGRLADAPARVGEALDIGQLERLAVVLGEKEPVAAPRDVPGNAAQTGHLDRRGLLAAPARHVLHRDSPIRAQRGGDDAHRRVQAMLARLDASQVRERHHEADGAVAAHADHANVVEEDDARSAALLERRHEKRADDHVGAARLVDASGAVTVELARQALAARSQAAAAEVREPVDHDARGLAAGMRVDDAQFLHLLGLDAELFGKLPELLDFAANHAREFLGCVADRLQARLDAAFGHLGQLERLHRLRVPPPDDLGARTARRAARTARRVQPEPLRRLEARVARLDHRRDVGERREALERGEAEDADLAAAVVRDERRRAGNADLDLSAEQVADQLAAALVG